MAHCFPLFYISDGLRTGGVKHSKPVFPKLFGKAASEPRFPCWSLLWRLQLFGPILMPLGALLLACAFAALLGPFSYSVILFVEHRYGLGAVVLVAAIISTPLSWRFLNWLLEGYEYSSL